MLASAERTLDATYEAPILAHANMEPLGATARFSGDGCELWVPSQNLQRLQADIANIFGLEPEQVLLHHCHMGGAFGRRIESEVAVQAVSIAKELHEQGLPDRPVRLVWSREQDMRHDCYRPPYVARLRAALDESGRPSAWTAKSAGHSLLAERWPWMVEESADPSSVGALFNDLYAVPNRRVSYVMRQMPVRGGFWRSVAASMNSFFAESFLDEVAHAGGRNPVELRAELTTDSARAQSAGDGGRRLDRAKRHSGGQAVLQLHRHSGGTGNQGRGVAGAKGPRPPWTADWRWIRTTSRRRSRAPSCMA